MNQHGKDQDRKLELKYGELTNLRLRNGQEKIMVNFSMVIHTLF